MVTAGARLISTVDWTVFRLISVEMLGESVDFVTAETISSTEDDEPVSNEVLVISLDSFENSTPATFISEVARSVLIDFENVSTC